jgi:phosphoribosylglycinamide formyltransferase 1
MQSIVILISGRGSNMTAIVEAAEREDWRTRYAAEVRAVTSNRSDAAGLAWAAARGIRTAVVDHKRFASRAEFDAALAESIDGFGADLLLMAGFMRIMGEAFTQRYEGCALNIHPSLLPAFPGLHTHEKALAAGVKFHGATVHEVSAVLDGGRIVQQAVVPVMPGDTADSLAARVLTQEHLIYPKAVREFLKVRHAS